MQHIDAKTKLIGLLGLPVDHSFSPAMQNAAFEQLGLNYVYLAFPVNPEDVGTVLKAFRAAGVAGLNITAPHKQAVIPCLDEITPEAVYAGAVNTIVNDNGRLVGYNTDGAGFLRSLEKDGGIKPEDKTFMLLGAGGACRAVAAALALRGARQIYVANRSYNRAMELAEKINQIKSGIVKPLNLAVEEMVPYTKECDVVINTTAVGMYPQTDASPLADSSSILRPSQLVCDLIYNPPRTLFLTQAEKAGCSTLSGEGMLLYQGTEAFRLWTGEEPPEDLMRMMLRKQLKKARAGIHNTRT